MKISSKDFASNELIPLVFTCDGENNQPHVSWSEAPAATKSFALSVIDPDTSMGEFAHWLILNIPSDITEIVKGKGAPEGSLEVENDFGYGMYGGPCPPTGKHRYIFTIYALDTDSLENVTRDSFKSVVAEHTLDSTEIIGLYERQ